MSEQIATKFTNHQIVDIESIVSLVGCVNYCKTSNVICTTVNKIKFFFFLKCIFWGEGVKTDQLHLRGDCEHRRRRPTATTLYMDVRIFFFFLVCALDVSMCDDCTRDLNTRQHAAHGHKSHVTTSCFSFLLGFFLPDV